MHGDTPNAVGWTARSNKMTTLTKARAHTAGGRDILSIMLVAAIGVGLFFVAGHAQSAALHDAAHDTRHAAGFPCH
mgnify:CR=1 FL=1